MQIWTSRNYAAAKLLKVIDNVNSVGRQDTVVNRNRCTDLKFVKMNAVRGGNRQFGNCQFGNNIWQLNKRDNLVTNNLVTGNLVTDNLVPVNLVPVNLVNK